MDTTEESKKEKILRALKHITEICPNVVIGGSIAFSARGLLARDPNDIDIFVKKSKYKKFMGPFNHYGILDLNTDEIGSDTVTDMDGVLIRRTSLKIMGVKVCAFEVGEEEMKFDRIFYEGIEINAQATDYGIRAKNLYSDKNLKHKFDLIEINEKLADNKISDERKDFSTPEEDTTFEIIKRGYHIAENSIVKKFKKIKWKIKRKAWKLGIFQN